MSSVIEYGICTKRYGVIAKFGDALSALRFCTENQFRQGEAIIISAPTPKDEPERDHYGDMRRALRGFGY